MSRRFKFLIIGAGILLAMEWRALFYYLSPPPDFGQGKVTLYATDWCPYCAKTRALLEREHIAYQEYNIETSEEGRSQYQRLAGKGVPVLLIDGEVVRGYHEKTIVAALAHWQASQKK
jgi:glutaredoxin